MIASKDDLRRYVAEDLRMRGLGRWRPAYRLTNRTAYYTVLLRRSEYWANVRRDPVGRLWGGWMNLRVARLGERLGFTISRNCFGPGLSIAHYGMLVVNGQARIGSRCRIHHGVTLADAGRGAPTLGDDVFLGPNAVVVGAVTVGDRAEILPGAVVVSDVPADALVGGVPATVRRVREAKVAPWSPDSGG